MQIQRLDHLVLTVRDAQRSIHFYTNVLGMSEVTFGTGRKALSFGQQKINLHELGREVDPKAAKPTPGSADLCFISDTPMDTILAELRGHDIEIVQGPVERTGAMGPITSVYFRDPDQNLIEVSNYPSNG
jgi:catechol 2,3-dioxygenase-like lactoylglutathione lyase family enzyme